MFYGDAVRVFDFLIYIVFNLSEGIYSTGIM